MNKRNLLLLLSVCAFSASTVIKSTEVKYRWKRKKESKRTSCKKMLEKLQKMLEKNPEYKDPKYKIYKLNVHCNEQEPKSQFNYIDIPSAIAEIEAGMNTENFRTQK